MKMTTGQALVKFLDNQYVSFDGKEEKFVDGIFTVFGLGENLHGNLGNLKVYQGKNEQGMAYASADFAKKNNRRKIIACLGSIGLGATNMITAAATATVNNIPLLLLPGYTFETIQSDNILQQSEQFHSLGIETNYVFKPVCKYWDKINKPEELIVAMINAMRILTDSAETGTVCIILSQDVKEEIYDFPECFFKKRIHRISRPLAVQEDFEDALNIIIEKSKPIIICGGGVRYSEADEVLIDFAEKFNIPICETQAGKGTIKSSHPLNLGIIGIKDNIAANIIARDTDLVIGVGTRFSDFTALSKDLFKNSKVDFITINISKLHNEKIDSHKIIGDAKVCIEEFQAMLEANGYESSYECEIYNAKKLM